jgi:PAS domain S-box-containing protein
MPESDLALNEEHRFLKGGGELGDLIAAFDWGTTPLGPIANWSATLKTTVGLILRSPVAMATLWGEHGVMIYNDAYAVVAADRHPGSLGCKVREAWPEIADFNETVVRTCLAGGALAYKDQELTLYRTGEPEQAWLNLDYSPILNEEGVPVGVFAVVVETTAKVRAKQWLNAERERLRRMFEQAPGFMALLTGPDHVFDLANPAFTRIVGDREILGRPARDAMPEIVAQGYLDLLDKVYATATTFSASAMPVDLRRSPDGQTDRRFVDIVLQPVTGDAGEIVGIFVQGADVTGKIGAEEQAQAQEAQFRALSQAVPNHVWSATPTGDLDWFNDGCYAYSGTAPGEIDSGAWTAIIHPDDRDAAAACWSAALVSGEVYECEFRIRRHDGDYRWHLARALPIRDESGAILRWIGTNTDIHERKLAERESTRDRNRLWALSREMLVVCDFDGIITAANPSWTRILGWREDELIGHNLIEFLHPEECRSGDRELERLASGLPMMSFEKRYRTRDGVYRTIDWTAVPDAGRIHAVGRDITDERLASAALRASTRERDRIWNTTNDLMATAGADGRLKAVNPAWTRLLGYEEVELLGRAFLDIVDSADHARVAGLVHRLSQGDAVGDFEHRVIHKDGGESLIAWTAEPSEDGFHIVGRNVTAQRQAEDALRQSQKMEAVGQLTGGLAHDFNNLLQGITGSLDLVQKRVRQGRLNELDRFIAGAMTSATRASALTHRLLAFARRQPLDPRPVRANPLIASMEDLLRRTLGERIALSLVLDEALWLTLCDPNQLESAILNLSINARDAMPDGGKLTIETCNAHLDSAFAARQRDVRPGQYVCICVTDTGAGMSAETMAKAFEPFFTTKPIGQGTGLGLSMIYGFARQSDGYVKLYSELGRGTTVKLYLPRLADEGDADELAPEQAAQQTAKVGETVLVVEDECVVRELIVEVLGDLGYRALEAADGPAGLQILQSRERIDLLVTDMGLPGLNGRQVADAGRALRPGLKVLFMTGYAENAALASGFLDPGMEMITKPFPIEAIADRIRAILTG